MPRRAGGGARELQAGDVGIWVTCARSKEAPTTTDLHDLFQRVGKSSRTQVLCQLDPSVADVHAVCTANVRG